MRADYAELCAAVTANELLERVRIDYHAPADVATSGLGEASVDVVFSNSVMEHVPARYIARMMAESRRILRDDGVVMHCVNCGDHYAYFDRDITQINYLTYSDRAWSFWNNRLLYQNRLRPRDFTDLAKQANLEIILLKNQPRPELLAKLPNMTIASQFSHYPPEDLCSTSVGFVVNAE